MEQSIMNLFIESSRKLEEVKILLKEIDEINNIIRQRTVTCIKDPGPYTSHSTYSFLPFPNNDIK